MLGFSAFGALGLFMMTDNRFGSDGGGAIVLGIALAFLGARLLPARDARLPPPARRAPRPSC